MYREAIRIEPELVDVHYRLGDLLCHRDDYDGAEREFREVIWIEPEHAHAHFHLWQPCLPGARMVTGPLTRIRIDPGL